VYKYVGCKHIYEAPIKVTTIDKVPDTGFCTVYQYDESLLNYFTKHGCTKGFSKTNPVCYTDKLLVDFDNQLEAARDFFDTLVDMKVGFKVYNSGGRSIHFHIDRVPVASVHLPHSDKKWMEQYASKADMSLYQVGRVFRLEGTIHHDTGKAKVLIQQVEGVPLDSLPIVERELTPYTNGEVDYNKVFDDPIVYQSFMGYGAGERELNMFKLITHLREYGMNRIFIEEFVKCANEKCLPPLDEDRIEYILEYYLS